MEELASDMTLRQHYAALAMQAFVGVGLVKSFGTAYTARMAFEMADAMMRSDDVVAEAEAKAVAFEAEAMAELELFIEADAMAKEGEVGK